MFSVSASMSTVRSCAASADPRGEVERRGRKHADHQLATQQHVEDTGHQQLDQLRHEHQPTAHRRAPDRRRDINVAAAHAPFHALSTACNNIPIYFQFGSQLNQLVSQSFI